jgi:hypothetical protein
MWSVEVLGEERLVLVPNYDFKCNTCGSTREQFIHHKDYEKYIGVKFKTRQVHRHTSEYKPLPVPQENFEENLLNKVKVCIDVWKESIKEPDYENIVIAILDENGQDIYRQDASPEEIKNLMNADINDQFIHIWREYVDNKLPHSWRVWPYSTSKGWMDRIENQIKYE